jgi:hypothetical protein
VKKLAKNIRLIKEFSNLLKSLKFLFRSFYCHSFVASNFISIGSKVVLHPLVQNFDIFSISNLLLIISITALFLDFAFAEKSYHMIFVLLGLDHRVELIVWLK